MDNVSILIKILSIKGIGPATAKKLILPSYISCDDELIDFLHEKATTLSRLKLTTSIIRSGIEKGNRIISESWNHNISFLNYSSTIYPALLKTIENPPLFLSYKGDISLVNDKCVTIIGTREPSTIGAVAAYDCGKSLAESGFVITSGLARGIDSSAHLGCLDGGGRTIAVVGNGLDTIYPSENRMLADKILEGGGLIISESFINEKASAGSLLLRNRIIVGLCTHIIVAETGLKGGTMHTVSLGMKAGRKIGCLSHINENRIGTLQLIKNPEVKVFNSRWDNFPKDFFS